MNRDSELNDYLRGWDEQEEAEYEGFDSWDEYQEYLEGKKIDDEED